MRHVFLAPHADDVALSCGGMIAQRVQAGDEVVIVTVMMGEVPPVPLTPFIEEHFERWGLGRDPVSGRKAEDEAAARLLGATVHFGSIPDALYRCDSLQHGWLYPKREALFGAVQDRDPAPAQLEESRLWAILDGADVVYAPLGAGHHVDHQIVRDAMLEAFRNRSGVAFFLYEEYPYSAEGVAVVEQARAALDDTTIPRLRMLDRQAMQTKVQAIACYRSQLSSFWANPEHMEDHVRRYALQVGAGRWAERLWRVSGSLPENAG